MAGYFTHFGRCIQGDSLKVLKQLDDNSIDLIITSPPFSLQRHKSYGEVSQNEYVDWLLRFGLLAYEKLKDSGSFVIDLGGHTRKEVLLGHFTLFGLFCECMMKLAINWHSICIGITHWHYQHPLNG